MPLYEYRCLKCGAEFEKLVMKASDMADAFCPTCKSHQLEEKVSGFASFSKAGASSGTASCAPASG